MVRSYLARQSQLSRHTAGSSYSDAYDDSRSTTSSIHGERPRLTYHQQGSLAHDRRLDSTMKLLEYPTVKQRHLSTTPIHSGVSMALSRERSTQRSRFEIYQGQHEAYSSDATPSTPSTFAKSFSPAGKLSIHHDDSTSDGNMNLRVDSEISDSHGRRRTIVLFHLRMHELKRRRFTLHRHSRDLGHEIGSSSSKGMAAKASSDAASPPDHLIQLMLANDTSVTIEQQGSKRSKRYEFNISGIKHEWRRQLYSRGRDEEASYHLINTKTSESIAHITPRSLTPRAAREEEELGSWVPPCTMRITNRGAFDGRADMAELVVATGLITLVDDCIERTWHNKRRVHLHLPASGCADDLDPEQLIDEIFNRRPQTARPRRLQLR